MGALSPVEQALLMEMHGVEAIKDITTAVDIQAFKAGIDRRELALIIGFREAFGWAGFIDLATQVICSETKKIHASRVCELDEFTLVAKMYYIRDTIDYALQQRLVKKEAIMKLLSNRRDILMNFARTFNISIPTGDKKLSAEEVRQVLFNTFDDMANPRIPINNHSLKRMKFIVTRWAEMKPLVPDPCLALVGDHVSFMRDDKKIFGTVQGREGNKAKVLTVPLLRDLSNERQIGWGMRARRGEEDRYVMTVDVSKLTLMFPPNDWEELPFD